MTAIRGEAAGVPFAALPPDEPAVERYERLWDVRYRWSGRSLAVADRLDFVARADQIPARDALAEEPGVESAPQTARAAEVDAVLVDWFSRHMDASDFRELRDRRTAERV